MTTKAPPAVRQFPGESLERIAYTSVSGIPTQEPNDQSRLGYHVWQWLLDRSGTLADVLKISGARIRISQDEALKIISESLRTQGIQL